MENNNINDIMAGGLKYPIIMVSSPEEYAKAEKYLEGIGIMGDTEWNETTKIKIGNKAGHILVMTDKKEFALFTHDYTYVSEKFEPVWFTSFEDFVRYNTLSV